MKAERFILSFIAVLIGLLVAGGAFYLYQFTKKPGNTPSQTISIKNPTPTPSSQNLFTLNTPQDEQIVNSKTITVSGKVLAGSTIIASVASNDVVVKPSANGDYSLTMSITDGTNELQVTAIFPDGTEKSIARTITYSTEDF